MITIAEAKSIILDRFEKGLPLDIKGPKTDGELYPNPETNGVNLY